MNALVRTNYSIRVEVLEKKLLALRHVRTSQTRIVRGPRIVLGIQRRLHNRDNETWILFPEQENYGLPLQEQPHKKSIARDLYTAWDDGAIEIYRIDHQGNTREMF